MKTCTSSNCETGQDTGALSNPLSFLRSGVFGWSNGGLNNRGSRGYYWSLRSASTTLSNYLYFNNTNLYPQSSDNRGYGFAVRCVSNTEWSGGLAPDSICPKGWQLPTFDGDKSFDNLINTSYSINKADSDSRDSGVLSNPLSFLRSGYFTWNYASLLSRGSLGLYWSLRSANTTHSYYLYFYNTYLNPQHYNNRGFGFAVLLLRPLSQ